MKTKLSVCLSAVLIVSLVWSFTACVPSERTNAGDRTNVEAETEIRNVTESGTNEANVVEDYKAAYLDILTSYTNKYGIMKDSDSYYEKACGVLCAELLDWNTDGTPELMIVFLTGTDKVKFYPSIEIYAMQDEKANRILNDTIGSSYGFLGSDLLLYFTHDNAGHLLIRVDDGSEFKYLKETYYSYINGSVHSEILWAESSIGGWNENGNPAEPDSYQINGKDCTKEVFENKEKELHTDESVQTESKLNRSLEALISFLSGETDSYPGSLFVFAPGGCWYKLGSDEMPEWVDNIPFMFIVEE